MFYSSSVSAFSAKFVSIDEYGFIGGTTLSRFTNSDFTENNKTRKSNLFASYFISKHINDSLSLQLEFSIKRNSTKLNYINYWFNAKINIDENITLTYFEMPLFAKMPFSSSQNSKVQIYGGPFVGLLLKSNRNGSFTVSGSTLIQADSYSGSIPNSKKIQYGITLGTDFRLKTGKRKWFLMIRYSYYISNMFKKLPFDYIPDIGEHPVISQNQLDFLKLKYSQWSIGIGWNFNLLK